MTSITNPGPDDLDIPSLGISLPAGATLECADELAVGLPAFLLSVPVEVPVEPAAQATIEVDAPVQAEEV